ncbi:MAG: aldo/keto reductase [Candidatus Aminicenantes bacterium]|nr:aldo/keto reductase [Candidatus Aminicenantes bacterium]
MNKNKLNRRDFIKTSLTAALAVNSLSCESLFKKKNVYDSKGLPTRILGKTGIKVPLIVIGGGSRFCNVTDPEKSMEILTHALDNGLYYWDTAHSYVYNGVVAEKRYGLILKDRRDEVFLSTKFGERTYDGAMRQFEESLKRLQTDHVDLLQIHLITSLEDVDKIGAENGALKALIKLKQEKATRFIGFSGHLSAEAMAEAARRYDFDTMLIALNHYSDGKENFEKKAIPEAAKKNMGILVMKVIRPKETVPDINTDDLIHYALNLEHVSAAVIGTDGMDVLKKNIQLLKNFKPMSAQKMQQMTSHLKPFFESKSLEWMNPGYTDGIPV